MDAVDQYLLALDEAEVDATRLATLERDFVAHARPFADRRGISFGAWRDVGVPVSVLARAGIRDD